MCGAAGVCFLLHTFFDPLHSTIMVNMYKITVEISPENAHILVRQLKSER